MESGFGEALGPMLKAWKWEDEEQGESESSPVKFESLSEEQREETSSHTGSGFSLTYLLLEGQTCQQTSLVPVGMDLMKVFIRREKNKPSLQRRHCTGYKESDLSHPSASCRQGASREQVSQANLKTLSFP